MILNDHFGTKNQNLPIEKNVVFFQELKKRIHRRLIERIDISKLDMLGAGDLTREIGYIIESLIADEQVPLNQAEKERLIVDIQHETFGLGHPLLRQRPRLVRVRPAGSALRVGVPHEEHGHRQPGA